MATITAATIPVSKSYDNSGEVGIVNQNSSERDALVNYNAFVKSFVQFASVFMTDGVLVATALSRGTTVTLATTVCTITIAGVPVSVAAQTGQVFGSLGTIPASTWGIIAVDAVAAGTISFVSGAANYTTGYTTEALAIAAAPAKTANKARIGYVTVLASASTWVAGTDALAGGSGGNPATATSYYNIASPLELVAASANAATLGSVTWQAYQIGNMSGTVLTS